MKTLAVCYSKTGTTKTVAAAVTAHLGCDYDEIAFDEAAKTVTSAKNPADYDRVILFCPIWAFSLAEPMKLYLKQHGKSITQYSLIVTCGGMGLGGCVKNCEKAIGKPPEKAVKLKSKAVKAGAFDAAELV